MPSPKPPCIGRMQLQNLQKAPQQREADEEHRKREICLFSCSSQGDWLNLHNYFQILKGTKPRYHRAGHYPFSIELRSTTLCASKTTNTLIAALNQGTVAKAPRNKNICAVLRKASARPSQVPLHSSLRGTLYMQWDGEPYFIIPPLRQWPSH